MCRLQRMTAVAMLCLLPSCASEIGKPISWGSSGGDSATISRFGSQDTSIMSATPGMTEVGRASWYGPTFYGKKTASGAIFHKHDLTAAHRTLPLGTEVRVTNLANERSVDVLVNDRGPFVSGRIIDLSWEAANRIGIIGPGTGLVKITVLSSPGGRKISPSNYLVQVASFSGYQEAMIYARSLRHYPGAEVRKARVGNRRVYRVYVGRFQNPDRARSFARRVKSELGQAFVVEADAR